MHIHVCFAQYVNILTKIQSGNIFVRKYAILAKFYYV